MVRTLSAAAYGRKALAADRPREAVGLADAVPLSALYQIQPASLSEADRPGVIGQVT
jgi:hypothetical protein